MYVENANINILRLHALIFLAAHQRQDTHLLLPVSLPYTHKVLNVSLHAISKLTHYLYTSCHKACAKTY